MKQLNKSIFSIVVVAMFLTFLTVAVQAGPCELPEFVASDFSTSMNNPFLPKEDVNGVIGVIGYTFVYEAETGEGLVRDYIYFSTAAKEILGIDCTVVYDVEWLWVEDISDWRKLEETDDWHAWDQDGNFWYFGEETTEYEWNDEWDDYETSDEGSWEAGIDGALPGIILTADPKQRECVLQEYYEDEAEDVGKVLRLNGDVSDLCDKDCLVTKEWTKLEPGNVEHKYYAPDLGLVYIEELKEKTVIFELVDIFAGPPPGTPPAL